MLIDFAARFPEGAAPIDLFAQMGLVLRRAAENPKLTTFEAQLLGGKANAVLVDELYPLADEDLEQVLERLVWQCARLAEVTTEVGAEVRTVALYRTRLRDAFRAAWHSSEVLSNLADSDRSLAAVRFNTAMEKLGLRGNTVAVMKFCDLVLSCQPSAAVYDPRAMGGVGNMVVTPSGLLGVEDLRWLSLFTSNTVRLLRTKIPKTLEVSA